MGARKRNYAGMLDHRRGFQPVEPAQRGGDRLLLETNGAQAPLERLGLGAGAEVVIVLEKVDQNVDHQKGLSGLGNALIATARQSGDLTIQFQVEEHHRNDVSRQAAPLHQLVQAAGIESHRGQ